MRLKPRKRFNPRSHEGSDGIALRSLESSRCFNPRSHEGSDTAGAIQINLASSFQSTLPRRERLYYTSQTYYMSRFQSTLPRRERRADLEVRRVFCDVSIHAPTKGATSAPYSSLPRCVCFNPRSHEGSDVTPVKYSACPRMFQSTLPRRERPQPSSSSVTSRLFQSTLPRRERLNKPTPSTLQKHSFNPRSHEGSDQRGDDTNLLEGLFQSTLPRRERQHRYRSNATNHRFNPRSHEGSDGYKTQYVYQLGRFNPRSHEGSDEAAQYPIRWVDKFQSTLPRRERLST